MRKYYTLLAIALAIGVGMFATAGQRQKVPSTSGGGESYHWYDGDVRRSAQANPEKLAVVSTSNKLSFVSASERVGVRDTARDLTVYTTSGESMALPGGVIVKFYEDWSQANIESWMSENSFENYRAIIGSQVWLIDTASGLVSLELANQIHESGEVVYASPNWSRDRSAK